MKIKVKDISKNKDTRFDSLEGFVAIQTKEPDQEIFVPLTELEEALNVYKQ